MMEQTESLSGEQQQYSEILLAGLSSMLNSGHSLKDALSEAVKTAQLLTSCEHVFLTRYNQATSMFTAYVWQSTINPGAVAAEQKFMGDSYLANETVFIADLPHYNYRLRSSAARLGFKSMMGAPLHSSAGLLGALECFSREQDFFTEEQLELLCTLAKQAALLIDCAQQAADCRLWAIENAFIHDLHASDQSSPGTLLYKLGEALADLFTTDFITVFGVEQGAQNDALQEVMAKGFSAQDVATLKKVINSALLDKLKNRTDFAAGVQFIKHSFGADANAKKAMIIAPIAWRNTLHGLVVYYEKADDSGVRHDRVERFAARMIEYAASVLNRKNMYGAISRISFTDALTQLPNRRLFDYIFSREYEKVTRSKQILGLLMIDIDHFKRINDQYGHQAGDAILEQLGAMLKKSFRSIDLPARFGGEEFAVILPDTNGENTLAAAERFRSEVETTVFTAGSYQISLTVSIGIAMHSSRTSYADSAALLYAADQALYRAKQSGRNRTMAAG